MGVRRIAFVNGTRWSNYATKDCHIDKLQWKCQFPKQLCILLCKNDKNMALLQFSGVSWSPSGDLSESNTYVCLFSHFLMYLINILFRNQRNYSLFVCRSYVERAFLLVWLVSIYNFAGSSITFSNT